MSIFTFQGFMAANLGIGLSVIFILQLCKFLWKDWLTKDDIKENNRLTLGAAIYSLVVFLLIAISM